MKKLIVALVILVPALSFAQIEQESEINLPENNIENPFTSIDTREYIQQDYLDLNQTAAMLNLSQRNGRKTRGATRGATSIPRTTVDVNSLTKGLDVEKSESTLTLNSIFDSK